MKRSASKNFTFKPIPIRKSITLKYEQIPPLHSRSEVSSANPFDNMKIRENSKPSLRPIINRHRKSPSCVLSEKSPNQVKILKARAFPLLYQSKFHAQPSDSKRVKTDPSLSPLPQTPYFSSLNKENQPDFSFGLFSM